MTDAPTAPPAASPADGDDKPKKPGFRFTGDGCLTELRLGSLLVLAGTFLWNFVGPTWAMRVILVGAPILVIGAVMQALAARRGIPGMPWKMALAMLVLGGAMTWDFRYRSLPGGAIDVIQIGPVLLGSGLWILLCLIPAQFWLRRARAEESA